VLPDDYDLPIYDGPTVDFVIHYDPAREEAALLLARRLFAELDFRIESLTLVPGAGEDFDVWLDGERIHSTRASGGEPSAARASALAWRRLRPDGGPASPDTA
jgi:predicted Rdx family selenoprotein